MAQFRNKSRRRLRMELRASVGSKTRSAGGPSCEAKTKMLWGDTYRCGEKTAFSRKHYCIIMPKSYILNTEYGKIISRLSFGDR